MIFGLFLFLLITICFCYSLHYSTYIVLLANFECEYVRVSHTRTRRLHNSDIKNTHFVRQRRKRMIYVDYIVFTDVFVCSFQMIDKRNTNTVIVMKFSFRNKKKKNFLKVLVKNVCLLYYKNKKTFQRIFFFSFYIYIGVYTTCLRRK